jgi:CRP-like cAMP-binding protein
MAPHPTTHRSLTLPRNVTLSRLGRWNLVGELGLLLDYREPFTARIEREGEVLALPPDAIAAVLSDSPDVAHRLQRLALLTLASKLEKVSQTLASS